MHADAEHTATRSRAEFAAPDKLPPHDSNVKPPVRVRVRGLRLMAACRGTGLRIVAVGVTASGVGSLFFTMMMAVSRMICSTHVIRHHGEFHASAAFARLI